MMELGDSWWAGSLCVVPDFMELRIQRAAETPFSLLSEDRGMIRFPNILCGINCSLTIARSFSSLSKLAENSSFRLDEFIAF